MRFAPNSHRCRQQAIGSLWRPHRPRARTVPPSMRRRDEVTVGILVTIAVVILVLGTLWLARGGLKSGYPVHTRFVWGQNLKQGQPVLLAGVSVGYVADVSLKRDGY